jgi:hypothetical protein
MLHRAINQDGGYSWRRLTRIDEGIDELHGGRPANLTGCLGQLGEIC